MKNKHIILATLFCTALSSSITVISSAMQDASQRFHDMKGRQNFRAKNGGVGIFHETDLHDIAQNCDFLQIEEGGAFFGDPTILNLSDQTASDLVEERLNTLQKNTVAYNNCLTIKSILKSMENAYSQGCDDTRAYIESQTKINL